MTKLLKIVIITSITLTAILVIFNIVGADLEIKLPSIDFSFNVK